MAKRMKFRAGSSGSPKHTEHYGDGSKMFRMGNAVGTKSARSDESISVGPGVMGKRVTADYERNRDSDGGRARGKPSGAYTEE